MDISFSVGLNITQMSQSFMIAKDHGRWNSLHAEPERRGDRLFQFSSLAKHYMPKPNTCCINLKNLRRNNEDFAWCEQWCHPLKCCLSQFHSRFWTFLYHNSYPLLICSFLALHLWSPDLANGPMESFSWPHHRSPISSSSHSPTFCILLLNFYNAWDSFNDVGLLSQALIFRSLISPLRLSEKLRI